MTSTHSPYLMTTHIIFVVMISTASSIAAEHQSFKFRLSDEVTCNVTSMDDSSATGIISIRSQIPGATITVDGRRFTMALDTIMMLPIGRKILSAERDNFELWLDTLMVTATETTYVYPRLIPNVGFITIDLSTPAIEVEIDSTRIPRVRGPVKQKLACGWHEVAFRISAEELELRRRIYVSQATHAYYSAEVSDRSGWPILFSAAVPGSGQFYHGAHVKGIAIGTLQAASIVYVALSATKLRESLSSFQDARTEYNNARETPDVIARRTTMEERYRTWQSASRTRQTSLYIAWAIYALNILDATLFHSRIRTVSFELNKLDGVGKDELLYGETQARISIPLN